MAAYQQLPRFLCLDCCGPGALGARLLRGFPRAAQIMRGNVVIGSQEAGGSGLLLQAVTP